MNKSVQVILVSILTLVAVGLAIFTVYYLLSNKDVNKVTTSDYMFEGCINLVGEKGTKYNSSYIDKTYARIDSSINKGYFTKK